MNENLLTKVLPFLERLDQARITYFLRHSRDDALMVLAHSPGCYWEIEFLENGDIEIERYRSDGEIEGENKLNELFAMWEEDGCDEKEQMSSIELTRKKLAIKLVDIPPTRLPTVGSEPPHSIQSTHDK